MDKSGLHQPDSHLRENDAKNAVRDDDNDNQDSLELEPETKLSESESPEKLRKAASSSTKCYKSQGLKVSAHSKPSKTKFAPAHGARPPDVLS